LDSATVIAMRQITDPAASQRKFGRKATARAYDALIAATALANRLPVYAPDVICGCGKPGLVPGALP
jgi:predicted nucleic acid-binding protein